MTPERRRLYAEAMTAFAAAREALATNAIPGTPQWVWCQELCRAAMTANDAYIRELESPNSHSKRGTSK
jgi:hypothetical protein